MVQNMICCTFLERVELISLSSCARYMFTIDFKSYDEELSTTKRQATHQYVVKYLNLLMMTSLIVPRKHFYKITLAGKIPHQSVLSVDLMSISKSTIA